MTDKLVPASLTFQARTIVRIIFAFSVLLFCVEVTPQTPPPNFGVVIAGDVYRGGQPKAEQYDHLHELGVKTILKLNHHALSEEREAAKRLGIKLVSVPMSASTIGSSDTCGDVAEAFAVLTDKSNWPIYVHCSRGRDRTGYLVGIFRQRVQGWTWERVDEELARYGYANRLREKHPRIAQELRDSAPSCEAALSPRHESPVLSD